MSISKTVSVGKNRSNKSKTTDEPKLSVYQKLQNDKRELADYLIEQINTEGDLPWNNPLNSQYTFSQHNPITNKIYKGNNAVRLYVETIRNGYSDNRWITVPQMNKKNKDKPPEEWEYVLKKGSKGVPIEFYKEVYPDTEDWEKVTKNWSESRIKKAEKDGIIRIYQRYHVFNSNQFEKFPEREPLRELTPEEKVKEIETIIAHSEAPISYDGNGRNYYSPISDSIHLTTINVFKDHDRYYATALHEISHSTGHKDRLDRFPEVMNIEERAKEELVAEFTSTFMSQKYGIGKSEDQIENHAAYLKSWAKAIDKNPTIIGMAMKDAEHSMSYIEEKMLTPYLEKEQVNTIEPDIQEHKEMDNKLTRQKDTVKTIKNNETYEIAEPSKQNSQNARMEQLGIHKVTDTLYDEPIVIPQQITELTDNHFKGLAIKLNPSEGYKKTINDEEYLLLGFDVNKEQKMAITNTGNYYKEGDIYTGKKAYQLLTDLAKTDKILKEINVMQKLNFAMATISNPSEFNSTRITLGLGELEPTHKIEFIPPKDNERAVKGGVGNLLKSYPSNHLTNNDKATVKEWLNDQSFLLSLKEIPAINENTKQTEIKGISESTYDLYLEKNMHPVVKRTYDFVKNTDEGKHLFNKFKEDISIDPKEPINPRIASLVVRYQIFNEAPTLSHLQEVNRAIKNYTSSIDPKFTHDNYEPKKLNTNGLEFKNLSKEQANFISEQFRKGFDIKKLDTYIKENKSVSEMKRDIQNLKRSNNKSL